MRILSWNTNHRKVKIPDQVSVICALHPDVVLLQEVTPTTASLLRPLLADAGFIKVELSEIKQGAPPRHSLGVLTASRHHMEITESIALSIEGWSEKVLSCLVSTPQIDIQVHNVHIPPGSTNGKQKIILLKAIHDGLLQATSSSRILCGDFNTPRLELPEGRIVTWAQHETAPDYRLGWKGRGEEWDDAERSVISGPPGMRDAFRALHGYKRVEFSWQHVRKGKTTRRRFDHAFVSSGLEIRHCEYIHEWRELGLSDHSAIVVEVDRCMQSVGPRK